MQYYAPTAPLLVVSLLPIGKLDHTNVSPFLFERIRSFSTGFRTPPKIIEPLLLNVGSNGSVHKIHVDKTHLTAAQ